MSVREELLVVQVSRAEETVGPVAQEIDLWESMGAGDGWSEDPTTRIERALIAKGLPPVRSMGKKLKVRLLANYGDRNYIGLNGMELFDGEMEPLLRGQKTKFRLVADPVMASAEELKHDLRVPENLYNGINDGKNRNLHWLAPFINAKKLNDKTNMGRLFNQIVIYFEKPVDITAISFWNYTKDPERGAKDMEIYLDEKLVCSVNWLDSGLYSSFRKR